jgi:hypothetical protein
LNIEKKYRKINFSKITYLLLVFIILLLPTSSALSIQAEVKIVAINDVIFISSHWDGQTKEEDNVMSQRFRDLRIVEDETFTANVTFKNVGRYLINTNVTLNFEYSGISLQAKGEIDVFHPSQQFIVSVPNLPAPKEMNWNSAKILVYWEAFDHFNQKVNYLNEVRIKPYTKNFDIQLPLINDQINMIDNGNNNHGNKKLEDPDSISTFSTSGSYGNTANMLNIWEGGTVTKSVLIKGKGPVLSVLIKFDKSVSSGFYMQYTLDGYSHNNWRASYTHYWSGSFSAGSTWQFNLHLGWNFAASRYVFGQGEYGFYRAYAYGFSCSYCLPSWSTWTYNDGSSDDFKVAPTSDPNFNYYHQSVFLSVIYDSYITSNIHCLDKSASYYINEVKKLFENRNIDNNKRFIIDYYITLKQINWLEGEAVKNFKACGKSGTLYTTGLKMEDIMIKANKGHQNVLGLSQEWQELVRSSVKATRKGNHGYDQALSITGLLKSSSGYDSDASGAAEWPGNNAFTLAGLQNNQLSNIGFISAIQHELSHNWSADHDNSNQNVMRDEGCGCTNWNNKAMDEFYAFIVYNLGFHNLPV